MWLISRVFFFSKVVIDFFCGRMMMSIFFNGYEYNDGTFCQFLIKCFRSDVVVRSSWRVDEVFLVKSVVLINRWYASDCQISLKSRQFPSRKLVSYIPLVRALNTSYCCGNLNKGWICQVYAGHILNGVNSKVVTICVLIVWYACYVC